MERSTEEARCRVCGGQASRPRDGLCTACFLRSGRDEAHVGRGCAVCGLDDPDRLVSARLEHERAWLCHDHAWVARCAWPPPATVSDLVWLLTRGRPADQAPRDPNRPS